MKKEDIEIIAKEHDIEIVIFDNPSYDTAIIGLSTNFEVVYDYDLMVEYLMKTEEFTVDDAIDFIEYNTIRALPYCIGNHKPVIVRRYF